MLKLENLKPNEIGLVQQQDDGRIIQIGMTKDQSILLQNFLVILSKESPLVKMGEDYELVLKSQSTTT